MVAEGRLLLAHVGSSTHAWLGDRALDLYLSMHGREENLPPKYLEQISARLFSAKNLGGGNRQISEEKEEDTGREFSRADQAALMRVFEPIMSRHCIFDPENEGREGSVSALVRRQLIRATLTTSDHDSA